MDSSLLGCPIRGKAYSLAVCWIFCIAIVVHHHVHGNYPQYNVKWSGSHIQTTQHLRSKSPVLLCNFRYCQTPLELGNMLWSMTILRCSRKYLQL
jgi:hypothetical protein